MAGRAASVISPFYSILLVSNPLRNKVKCKKNDQILFETHSNNKKQSKM